MKNKSRRTREKDGTYNFYKKKNTKTHIEKQSQAKSEKKAQPLKQPGVASPRK